MYCYIKFHQNCLHFCIIPILDIEIVKEAVPQLKLEKESPQTPTIESPQTPTKESPLKTSTNESICTPTKDTIEHENVTNLKEPSVDPAVHLTSPLVQSMRGNETYKVSGQEKINDNQSINEKKLETVESVTGLNKSKENQNVDFSPIKNNGFENKSENAATSTTAPPTSTTTTKNLLVTPEHENTPTEFSETASVSSWLSIDDDIKVKKTKGEQIIKSETTPPVSG